MIEFIKKILGGADPSTQKYQQLSAARMEAFIKEENIKNYEILDVRTPEEFISGHLKKARNINLFDPGFDQKLNNLDKNKTYFVICRSGNRSGSACKKMSQLGFEKLYNISGGMMGWPGEVV